tara:strand:+ start:84 stop:632 length:549 start_codon:yes stop_codon:yes gene_type:complete
MATKPEYTHFQALATILVQTQTRDITQWNEDTYTRALGWGLYFETTFKELQQIHQQSNTNTDSSTFDNENQEWISNILTNTSNNSNNQDDENDIMALKQITPTDLLETRDLIDRYILHSPFIDLNQTLLAVVLQRPGSKAIMYLQDRYRVDTTLQVAHTIHTLLKKSIAAATAATAAAATHT